MRHLKFFIILFFSCVPFALSQSDAQLTKGLIAYLPLKGNANDKSGNGNNGFAQSVILSKNRFGDVDSAFKFNGNSSIDFLNLI